MLSVSSDRYTFPYLVREASGQRAWHMSSRIGKDVIAAVEFNFTLKLYDGDNVVDRMTFHYCKSSVKPNARTLRKYGAEDLSRVVSILSKATRDNFEETNRKLVETVSSVTTLNI